MNGEIYSHTFNSIPDNQNIVSLGNNNVSLHYDGEKTTLIIGIAKSSTKVEYIDLFEGSIAYPHVKEDYAIALMRCKLYVQTVGNIHGNMQSSKSLIASLQTNLIAQPSATVNGGTIQVDGKFAGTVTSVGVQEYGEGSICLVIYSSSSESIDNGECGRFFGGRIILSCEPQ